MCINEKLGIVPRTKRSKRKQREHRRRKEIVKSETQLDMLLTQMNILQIESHQRVQAHMVSELRKKDFLYCFVVKWSIFFNMISTKETQLETQL